jgi:hypothetical protein
VLTHANLFVIKSGTMVIGCGDPKRFYPHFPANTDPVDPCIGALGSIPLGTESCPGVNGCANVRMGTPCPRTLRFPKTSATHFILRS